MAGGELKLEVSIEAAVHDAFKGIAERMVKDHGFIIRNVNISWTTMLTANGRGALIERISIDSETIHGTEIILMNPKA